jgi:hypothetical protein
VDERPVVEHEGQTIQMKLFIFFVVGVHIDQRGNYVTNDYVATQRATDEIRGLAVDTLARQEVAAKIVPEGAADFELKLQIEHLYATHYDANRITVLVSKNNKSADVDTRRYAPYGNAILHATLIDHRGGAANVVWSEYVAGYGEGDASGDRIAGCQRALRSAAADAIEDLTARVAKALDELGVGPSGPPAEIAQGSPLPSVFIIERISRYRDFLERAYVETATGRVLRHVVIDAPDRYSSRPGDWVLGRTTEDGVTLSPAGYELFARALAARYDLRRVDDAAHYHFFGVRGTAPPPIATTAALASSSALAVSTP